MTTALFRAVESGDLAEVNRLLEKYPGINVDALNYDGNTSLIWCIRNAHKPIVEVLLAHGAAVNGPVGARKTPLQQACYSDRATSRSAQIVSLLLEFGADVDTFTARETRRPLTLACRSKFNLGIIQLLLNAGADVNGGGGIIAPLHQAAYAGNTEAIALLLQSGADVNILSNDSFSILQAGSTPLHFAPKAKDLSCLNLLLKAGADPNISNTEGQTLLHYAASSSRVDFVNALLDAGCDLLQRDNRGRTPLQHLYERNRYIGVSAKHFNNITAFVAAGDRSWECVPTPCPGLQRAMLSVWLNAPDELTELVKHMENPPQTLIELFPRMDEEMKKVVQEVLRGLHHHFAGYPHLKEQLMKSIFDFATV